MLRIWCCVRSSSQNSKLWPESESRASFVHEKKAVSPSQTSAKCHNYDRHSKLTDIRSSRWIRIENARRTVCMLTETGVLVNDSILCNINDSPFLCVFCLFVVFWFVCLVRSWVRLTRDVRQWLTWFKSVRDEWFPQGSVSLALFLYLSRCLSWLLYPLGCCRFVIADNC